MTVHAAPAASDVEARARRTLGISDRPIYEMVERCLAARGISGGTLVDVGCGVGNLRRFVGDRFDRYLGVDVVRYDGLPADAEVLVADLEREPIPLPDGSADVVAAVETVEHLENPRRFLRELTRVARPGGWVVVTTPNQLSLLSLLSLALKKRFAAFQDVHYPAHLTALLEVDLRRIAGECGLERVAVEYSLDGRIPGTARHYPHWLARRLPRALSDNLLMAGARPSETAARTAS